MNLERVARRKARKYGLNPDYFDSQIQHESGYDPNIVSPAGAVGVAQIMPDTASSWGVDPLRPRKALDAAASHMADYVKKYGSYEKALRAYNAGPAAIQASYGYPETNAYVQSILGGGDQTSLNPHQQPDQQPQSNGQQVQSTPSTPDTSSVLQMIAALGQTIDQPSVALGTQTNSNQDPLQQMIQNNFKMLEQLQGNGSADVGATGTTTPSSDTPMQSLGDVSGLPGLRGIIQRAKSINQEHLPYLYGGGHNSSGKIGGEPLDCSAAVSDVLGIDPRVSGAFDSWGEAGEGKRVTIYYNPEHVFMKINGRFWGTSHANPNGGAGWIPASNFSPEYLSGFKVRHPTGL